MVGVPMQLLGTSTIYKLNMQQIILFYNINHRFISFMQKTICARVTKDFDKAMPNANTLKEQTTQQVYSL